MAAGPSSTAPSVEGPASAGLANIPLFHAAWLFAAGILTAHWLWIRPTLALIALIPVAALCAAAALRAQRVLWIPLALLWLLLGAWCATVEPHPAPAPGVASLSDGLMRVVEGTVIDVGPVRTQLEQSLDEPSVTSPSEAIDLRLSSIEKVTDETDTQIPIEGTVRLTVKWASGSSQPFRCGETIRADARLLMPQTYHDAGVFSRPEYLLDQGITSTATVQDLYVHRLGTSPGLWAACRFSALQHAATTRLLALPASTQHLPGPLRLSTDDAVMLAAMVAGDRTYLSHSTRVGFERTGSFHMLVVSGFHLAIVAGCFFWVARRLRLPRVPATLITIAASFAYALFTGFATPVQRSFWMVALYLIGRLFYRDRSPLNVIGFAALCLLAASPRSLFESSFQMTLLAVVVIAGVAAPFLQATVHPYGAATRDLRLIAIDAKLPPAHAAFRVFLRMIAIRLKSLSSATIAWRIFPWAVRFCVRVIEAVVVSAVVELSMALPMAIDFHRITIFALPVNLFILPLLVVLMPAALLTLLALLIWQPLAILPGSVAALVLHLGVGLVHLFGSMRFGDFRIPTPLPIQSAAFWLLLAASIVLAAYGADRPWLRRAAWASLILGAVAAVVPRPIDRPRNALFVQAIDVGQGDSLLLITPDGETLLIDAGGFGGGPRQASQEFDIGDEVVSNVLWSRGIRHLDAVALSHAHSDHMGGMPAVLRNFQPDELWVGNNPSVDSYTQLLDEAARLHTRVRTFRAGDGFQFGDAQVAVLAPAATYRPAADPANNDSLVLRVAYGSTSVLFEGDAEAPIERAMLAEANLQSTLLKVGHHGSLTSTSPEFLSRVGPEWAVISCGLNNRYRHPRPEILSELEEAHARTYRTDIDGASCFLLDGKSATSDYTCGWRGIP